MLQDTLDAFGFPEELRGAVATMYNGATTCTKVNGHKSHPWRVSSGCPLSAVMFILVQEVQLHMICTDVRIEGITIPGPSGSDAPGQT
eukprot:2363634-Prymnesium_polylepis.1